MAPEHFPAHPQDNLQLYQRSPDLGGPATAVAGDGASTGLSTGRNGIGAPA